MKHIDIMQPPFCDLIFTGEKTIESRFTLVKCPPFKRVYSGDIVYIKKSGGDILGKIVVDKVSYFEKMTPSDWIEIKKYQNQLCAYYDPDFWDKRKKARYVSLIFIKSYKKYSIPQKFVKKDRRGWVVLSEQNVKTRPQKN